MRSYSNGVVSDFDADAFVIYRWCVKVESFMSIVKSCAPLCEMTLLNMSLMSSNNVVLVPVLPEWNIKFPPTVILV